MSVLHKLRQIEELPTIPEIHLRLQELLASDECGAVTLARLVEQDPALSANILKLANSAFFGPVHSRIGSVQRAIVRLGLHQVYNVIVATGFVKKLNGNSDIIDYRAFWRHSLTAGHLAQMIGVLAGPRVSAEEREVLFAAGLLHDIGILIYDQYLHRDFQLLVDASMRHEQPYVQVEKRLPISESHGSVGATVLELWKMNPLLSSAVRFHHNPSKAPQFCRTVAYAVYLAEHILCSWILGGFEGVVDEVDEQVWSVLGISEDQRTDLVVNAQSEVEKSDLILAMALGQTGELLRTI